MDLTENDRKILELLSKDSRASYTDLSKELGISDVAVKKRIDKLLSEGVIKNFTINIDYEKLGKPVYGIVLLKIIPKELERVKAFLEKTEEIISKKRVLGEYDFIIEIAAESITKLKEFIEEKLGNVKGVIETNTLILVE